MKNTIDNGTMTLSNLSQIICCNIGQATEYGVKLSWCFEDGKICGRVKKGDVTVWKKYYEGEHTHVMLARMNWDFSGYLSGCGAVFRAEREQKEREGWKKDDDGGKFAKISN
jgi:hypothetical protein